MDRTTRIVAPAAVALFVAIGLAVTPQPLWLALPAAAVSVAVASLLAVRQATGWPLTAGLAVVAAGVVAVCNTDSSNLGWFALCVVMGWCAFRTSHAPTAVLGLGLLLAWLTQVAQDPDEPGWGAWVAGTLFTAVASSLGRRQRELVDQLRAAQAGMAARVRAEERNRIAGEMHDVIGHALTVSLLHVSSARLALEDDPREAHASLSEAERLARKSLEEVRATVGLMRCGSGEAAPMPGASDLDELVESFRRAGTPVTFDVVGDPSVLSATAGLAAYRIVQEALTNVARHAPGSATTVRVEVSTDGTRLTVDSVGAPGRRTAEATGLLGMRERAETLGGHLTAGPRSGGWRVEAVLPA
ncbi:MAG: sensor histidine kinase [Actinomycetota bacterium]|nr:sensor histidine kinase [Actinomycetota bacterium]